MLAQASWSAWTPVAPVASDNPNVRTIGSEAIVKRNKKKTDRQKRDATRAFFDHAKVVAETFGATL
jgi:hypothetical protein